MKTGKKIAVLALIFVAAAIIYFVWPLGRKEENKTGVVYTAMGEAELPVVYPTALGRELAPLFGHREDAGVGRNTLYYHFEDKFDLVNWYFQSGATQFLVTRGHYASWSTLLTDLEEYLLQNKTFYVNALAYTGQNCLQEYVFHYLSEMFGQRLLSLVPSATERDCQF